MHVLVDWLSPTVFWLRSLLSHNFAPLVLSPFVGSTLGVLIHRLPRHLPVVWARSACESCGRRLSPLDLMPVISFIILRGRCRHCGSRIPYDNLAVEILAILLAVLAINLTDARADTFIIWGNCLLGWTLLALAWIDVEWLILPDVFTLPLLMAGLGWCMLEDPDSLVSRALGAAIGYTLFAAIGVGYRALRGREGLGAGDAKLLAACAAWLGAPLLAPLLLLSSLIGVVAAAWLQLSGRQLTSQTRLPFGPCLALATVGMRLWWSA